MVHSAFRDLAVWIDKTNQCWWGKGEQKARTTGREVMYPYSVHSSLLPRCVDAPQVEVPNLHYLVNILMKSTSEKDETTKTCAKFGRLILVSLLLFVFFCFTVSSWCLCLCEALCSYLWWWKWSGKGEWAKILENSGISFKWGKKSLLKMSCLLVKAWFLIFIGVDLEVHVQEGIS